MTQADLFDPPVFSRSQRHCHLVVMLCIPAFKLTTTQLCEINHVAPSVARQDIAEVAQELQCDYQLTLTHDLSGALQLTGSAINRHLCLLHTLRRALRISSERVCQTFVPEIRKCLQQQAISKALYDEHNLQALIHYCATNLQREFSARDNHFLQIYLQYLLVQNAPVTFTASQIHWLRSRKEYALAQEIIRCWHKQGWQSEYPHAEMVLAMLFCQIHLPDLEHPQQLYEMDLLRAIQQLIQQFEQLSGMSFRQHNTLRAQLFTHLAQALERIQFPTHLDQALIEDVAQQYPRLLRTTRAALVEFEQHFSLRFPDAEIGLVAIIFGAWLMQDNALQETQVVLLTGHDRELEQKVELQIRELTLLPLTIKYLPIEEYQQHGVPANIALVITPYVTTLPLFSPPLIHAELPLSIHQQQNIRSLLES